MNYFESFQELARCIFIDICNYFFTWNTEIDTVSVSLVVGNRRQKGLKGPLRSKKQGDLRNSLVLRGVTPLEHAVTLRELTIDIIRCLFLNSISMPDGYSFSY